MMAIVEMERWVGQVMHCPDIIRPTGEPGWFIRGESSFKSRTNPSEPNSYWRFSGYVQVAMCRDENGQSVPHRIVETVEAGREKREEGSAVSKIKGQIKPAREVNAGDVIILQGNYMLKVLFVQWRVWRRMVISGVGKERLPFVFEPRDSDSVFVVTDPRVTGHQ